MNSEVVIHIIVCCVQLIPVAVHAMPCCSQQQFLHFLALLEVQKSQGVGVGSDL